LKINLLIYIKPTTEELSRVKLISARPSELLEATSRMCGDKSRENSGAVICYEKKLYYIIEYLYHIIVNIGLP